MLVLKQFQQTKIKELLYDFLKLLQKGSPSSIVFEAPTGSGKTVMMQDFLKQLSSISTHRSLAFIWVSVGDLSTQSKKSFEKNLEGSKLIFSELKDIQGKALRQNEILFINWEKIKSRDSTTGKWKVLAMQDGEKDENIPFYMENSRNQGREIVLIIDESHKQLSTSRAEELINEYFKPIIQIEVSATPDSTTYDKKITVDIQDVIESGMIKKEVLVNENIDIVRNGEIVDYGTDKLILEKAIEKQIQLTTEYENEGGKKIKPLLLIQLPSESQTLTEIDRTKIDRVKQILQEDYDITLENQKLAIWLSDDKTNKDLIDIPQSPVQVLLFKQAIATGWDCPRAQILVMFRQIGLLSFQIQTVGRILRMPEQKHYKNESLNKAYVYTDLEKNSILVQESARYMVKNFVSVAKMDLYAPLELPSTFASRADYNDLGSSFYEFFFRYFIENILGGEFRRNMEFLSLEENSRLFQARININDIDIIGSIIKDGKIFVDIDHHTGEHIIVSDNSFEMKQEEELIELQFDNFCRSLVGPQFGNIARSYKIIKECFFDLFQRYILGEEYSRIDIQKLVLKNKDDCIVWLNEIKDAYKPYRLKEVEEKILGKYKNKTWLVPRTQGFSGENIETIVNKKYIYEPSYISFDSQIEKDFVFQLLETSQGVRFWYKNGVKLDVYFGIKYFLNGENKMFYPDFIVYYSSGAIGIFDTKDGMTLTSLETKAKAEALENYASELNSKGYKVIPGIIKRVGEGENIFFMIHKKGCFDFANPSSFELLNDTFIENFEFETNLKYSETYKQELQQKIVELTELKKQKEQEYAVFIAEQKNYDTLDNVTMIEKLDEIERISKEISLTSSSI